jgi:hypothetical protein
MHNYLNKMYILIFYLFNIISFKSKIAILFEFHKNFLRYTNSSCHISFKQGIIIHREASQEKFSSFH